ncbi:MAG: NAD-dependent epimerase/dehydratase family protein [Holophagaceae bacterium]|nr:NAD-dependent epimerase/dehydratase family protein [Holophagaceae bacterium]
MKILVTGGAGFIGSNLAEALLSQGHSVRVLDNFCAGDQRNLEELRGDLEVITGDITSPSDCARACAGIDAVSHQAALGSVPRSMLEPELYSFNNLHGFVTLCNQARLAGVTCIVYASSSSVYGDLTASPKTETMRGRPLSPYAASKQGNEDFAQAFHNAYGMTLVGFRYFNVFGPKQDPRGAYAAVIPLFISKLLKDEAPTIFGDGEQSRDFTFVGNVVQANLRALFGDLPRALHLVNVACGGEQHGEPALSGHRQGTELSTFRRPRPDRKGDIRDSLADVSRARELLGYSDWTTLQQGLAATVAWYRQHPERLT